MAQISRTSALAAGALGCLAFVLIGWSGLLVPSLIRSVETTFDQSDAGIGIFYFVYSAMYTVGSFGGGFVTERLGRRTVLTLVAALHGAGFVGLGIAPSWPVFLFAALPAGLGAGGIDGGMNGLFLDLFPTGRGRALNLLHVFFSIGALSAPLAVGRLVDAGIPWQLIVVASGLAAIVVAGVVRCRRGARRPARTWPTPTLDAGSAGSRRPAAASRVRSCSWRSPSAATWRPRSASRTGSSDSSSPHR